jgi:putative heme-binding domain-containing protein
MPGSDAANGTPLRKSVFWRFEKVVLLACLLSTLHTAVGETDSTDSTRKAINLEALSRLKGIDLDANPAVKTVLLKVLDQVRGTPQFVEIVRDFNLKGQEAALLDIASRNPSDPSGVEAMQLVLRSQNLTDLKSALDGTHAAELALALGNTRDKQIVPLLQPLLSDTNKPLALRKRAVESLARVQEGASAVLELAEAQKLPEDLRLTAATELNNVRWDTIKSRAAQVLPLPKSASALPLPPVSELVKLKGDAQKGTMVFRSEKVGCFKCHQVNGEGMDFGPNLSEIGTKLAKDAIYESILDPSAGISFGYEAWNLELKNGDDALGLIVSETPQEIALKSVGGIVTRYKKTEIARRTKQKLSIMPAGLEQTMSTRELVDLVEYLSSLKKAAK